jgi:hypothetical protein
MTTTHERVRTLLVAIAAVLAACEGPAGEPGAAGPAGEDGVAGGDGTSGAAVSVSPSTGTVEVGATLQLEATTTPAPETAETYTWASSNVEVATVDADGMVSGMAVGTALLVATGSDSGATGVTGVSVIPSSVVPEVSFANDVMPLFTTRNAWYVGGANCDSCHQGVDTPEELDMRTYDGIIAGADLGTEPIVVPGDWEASALRRRLRNNRMPFGISPMVPRNGPAVQSVAQDHPAFGWDDASSLADTNGLVKFVEAWIDEGAVDGDFDYVDSAGDTVVRNFDTHVLPLFTNDDVWAEGTRSCAYFGCHTGVDGAGELDMSSYDGIMFGADAGTEAIVLPGNSHDSLLRMRLRNNRMPLGIPNWVPRDGPNGEVGIVGQWVEDGALDN